MKRSLVALYDWLFRLPVGAEAILLPLVIIGWDTMLSMVIGNLLYSAEILTEEPYFGTVIASIWYPLELIYYAFEEELMFRIVPLALAMRFVGRRWFTLLVLLIGSVAFGYVHGEWGNILLQGLAGIAYGVLFIKYSDNGKRIVYAGVVVTLVHIIYNAFYVLSLASLGETVW